ncbi:uncharacterized protein L3040_007826 [Drepanopeziza brunnea f. sp. 'multigermtubi']|uniref:Zinc carboxypeptidase n=1 Tax=Marssonina brunnea f. sp. multigermtubi (strain MB_m1) TaxID=1072389 RepID=K1W7N0_MARBU|nr:zinc carboxypeptidase [Drepanopeziza brunnea f. sp. 'multigermtubi' MB_m1]EKD13105.1 zinc carboxypeptidase [Drepanopeziza brunnea f. sp. 'multigermtubi' MB_m1]KAJ5035352.1 hypothetical protein L3040_007826 [Drepanopeziza brunnea f. sp. 'multigermtubi']
MKFQIFASAAICFPLLAFACLLEEELEGLPMKVIRRQTGNTSIEIGAGDRYKNGKIAPRGVGSSTEALTSILNVNEIASGLRGLSSVYGVPLFTTPYKTFNGASITGVLLGGGDAKCNGAYRIYLNGGLHARERGSPDGILLFAGDLLYADRHNQGLTYGSKSYTAEQVKTVLAAGIVILPLINPDGVAWDHSTNSCWRKNRNTRSSTGTDASVGVDLNRNFDFLHDYRTAFAPNLPRSVASDDPSAENFHGPSAFSEAETLSMKWVMDTFSRIRWFLDLHSYAGTVIHSWGSDENQSEFPSMNFQNHTYDSVRGILTDTPGVGTGYGEYSPESESSINIEGARRIAAGMSAVAGRTYTSLASAAFYPTSGSSDDYAYSRHFVDPSLNLIHAYAIEFGFANMAEGCPFYPTAALHNDNMKEVGAGLMDLVLSATELGLGDATTC